MEAELETQPEGSITATQPSHPCAALRLSAGLSALDCSVLVLFLVLVLVSVSVSVRAPPGSLRVICVCPALSAPRALSFGEA